MLESTCCSDPTSCLHIAANLARQRYNKPLFLLDVLLRISQRQQEEVQCDGPCPMQHWLNESDMITFAITSKWRVLVFQPLKKSKFSCCCRVFTGEGMMHIERLDPSNFVPKPKDVCMLLQGNHFLSLLHPPANTLPTDTKSLWLRQEEQTKRERKSCGMAE